MILDRTFEVLAVLIAAWTFTRGDTDVSCQFNKNCILPCTFTVGEDIVIHWIKKTPAEFQVHSHYYNKDQLGHQDQRFRDRTSVFKDEISRGNASLLLTGVMVQDQGRYQCYTSTITGNEETFINLHVYDSDVSCQFNNSCILPCTFTGSDKVGIYWYQETSAEFQVHSHYDDKDQLGHQDQRFRDRTSLFKDEISRGNASLLLTGVMVQDQGRYQCDTRTNNGNEETFINVHVYAPVQKVNIQQVENNITCSSEDIYPEPELSWTSSPPSNMNLQKPAVQQTEQQLYTISSSLILSDSDTDLDYSCTISTPTSKRTATLMEPDVITASGAETTTISCSTSNYPLTNLIWRFNHHQTILTKSGAEDNYRASEGWRQHVESVSETGSLTLKDLSSDQTGTYTCELSDAEETYIKYTFLHVTDKKTGSAGFVVGFVAGFVAGVVVGVVVTVSGFLVYKKRVSIKEL